MIITPTESELKETISQSSSEKGPFLIPISYELLADLETPVSTFYKVCKKKPYSFLLESVEGGEKIGRYSIIGTDPILLFTSKDNKTYLENKIENKTIEIEENPFLALNNLLKNFYAIHSNYKNVLGFIGYFGYENIRHIEPKIKLNPPKQLADVCLILPEKLVIFDHVLHKVNLIINVFSRDETKIIEKYIEGKKKLNAFLDEFNKPKDLQPLSLTYKNTLDLSYSSNYSKKDFVKIVQKAKEYIYSGDIFQLVLSQKLSLSGKFDGFHLYRVLRSINPSPYLFYLNYGDFEIAGSSPEAMVKTECRKEEAQVTAILRPIAGTYPRGRNKAEDLENISKLSNDPKEKAEHLMLVDLARNDLGRVCEFGSVNVTELMAIEKYSHVLHMVSQVEGSLKKDKTSIELLSACFPAGTLTGAPKVRAMEIINELEKDSRGPYGGCIGLFGLNNSINTAMTIRTFLIYNDHLEIQVGAGIVADSDPEKEYEETLNKGAALIKAASILQ